eukprot:SAG31_NODE_7863_length_1580_cov_6.619851_2_plen_186_part_00
MINLRIRTASNNCAGGGVDLHAVPFHQDAAYLLPEADRTLQVGVWLPLVPVPPGAGLLSFLRGGHRAAADGCLLHEPANDGTGVREWERVTERGTGKKQRGREGDREQRLREGDRDRRRRQRQRDREAERQRQKKRQRQRRRRRQTGRQADRQADKKTYTHTRAHRGEIESLLPIIFACRCVDTS